MEKGIDALKDIKPVRILQPKFDAREEMQRVARDLGSSLLMKPMREFIAVKDRNQDRMEAQKHLQAVLYQISAAKMRYLERLETARETGQIDGYDYMIARMRLDEFTDDFERLKEKAREAYSFK